jgi:glycosyltransferase involved in cell wall biosynthesis
VSGASDRSITVVIACRDEERHLRPTFQAVCRALAAGDFARCEILVVDDGSRDATGAVADALAEKDPRVRVFHNPESRGFGDSFRLGRSHSQMTFLTVVPGDDEIEADSLEAILAATGRSDLVTAYSLDPRARPWSRRVLSRAFTGTMNVLFGQRLRYYNGPNVYATSDVLELPVDTRSFAFNAVVVTRLLQSGRSAVEVGMRLKPQPGRRSRALAPRNVAAVLRDVAALFWELRLRGAHAARPPLR